MLKQIRFLFFILLFQNVLPKYPEVQAGDRNSSHNKNDTVKNEYDVQIERDYVNNISNIYLYTNNIKSDSLKFNNVGFDIDSFINYKNIWWHYIFSECTSCVPSLEYKYQIILTPRKGKLHIVFASDFRYSHKVSAGGSLV